MTDEATHRLRDLHEDARYRRERLELYRARLYGGKAGSEPKLRELERAAEASAARVREAEARVSSSPGGS